VESFSKAIDLDPRLSRSWCSRAVSYIMLNQYQNAVTDAIKAVELDPSYAIAHATLGAANNYIAEYQKAIENYTAAIDLEPQSSRYYVDRSLTKIDMEDYKGAVLDLETAIDKGNGADAEPYSNRGFALLKLMNYEDAKKDCEKAIRLNPNFANAYCHLGGSYFGLGDEEQAIKFCTQAIQVNPSYGRSFFVRGCIYEKRKEYELAMADFNHFLELNKKETVHLPRFVSKEEAEKHTQKVLHKLKKKNKHSFIANMNASV